VQNEKPIKKIIELKRLTGKFSFTDSLGTDAQSIYIPELELEHSTLRFLRLIHLRQLANKE
jgi:hypothetical protein